MGAIFGDGIIIHGNFAKVRRYKTKDGRPKNQMRDYKCIVQYLLKWRHKIGKVECECTEYILRPLEPRRQFIINWEWRRDLNPHLSGPTLFMIGSMRISIGTPEALSG